MNLPPGSVRTVGLAPSDTSSHVVYEAEKVNALLLSVFVCNVTGSSADIDVEWVDDSESATFSLMKEKPFAAYANEVIHFENGFALDDGDQITIKAGTSSAFHVIVTVVEMAGKSV